MTRCAGSQDTGFACIVAGMQEPLDAARSVCAVVSALAGGSPAPAASPGDSLASGTPRVIEIAYTSARSTHDRGRTRKYVVHTTLICETKWPQSTVSAVGGDALPVQPSAQVEVVTALAPWSLAGRRRCGPRWSGSAGGSGQGIRA